MDSALVYRGLDIGTAKPSREVRARIPHHLIDICDAAESYSAGRFVADALGCIGEIHARGRVPLLVGGTMLYARALVHGLAPLPQAAPQLRRELDARAAERRLAALHAELAGLDPGGRGAHRTPRPPADSARAGSLFSRRAADLAAATRDGEPAVGLARCVTGCSRRVNGRSYTRRIARPLRAPMMAEGFSRK